MFAPRMHIPTFGIIHSPTPRTKDRVHNILGLIRLQAYFLLGGLGLTSRPPILAKCTVSAAMREVLSWKVLPKLFAGMLWYPHGLIVYYITYNV